METQISSLRSHMIHGANGPARFVTLLFSSLRHQDNKISRK